MNEVQKIRVVLADDHTLVRTGFKAVLAGANDIEVVGEASNGNEALALVEQLDPHVVVMDLTMPGADGTTATRQIVEKKLRARVLVLTMHAEDEYLVPLLSAGAAGYLVKTVADRELIDAVRTVARGETYIGTSAAQVLVRQLTQVDPLQEDRDRYERLTDRERNVLRYTALGYSAPEIGEVLNISPKTVDTYKQRIQEKLGLDARREYVQFALRLGLLQE